MGAAFVVPLAACFAGGGAACAETLEVRPQGSQFGSLIGNVASSGVGGAILMIIVGLIKQKMAK